MKRSRWMLLIGIVLVVGLLSGCGDGEPYEETGVKSDSSRIIHYKGSDYYYNYTEKGIYKENESGVKSVITSDKVDDMFIYKDKIIYKLNDPSAIQMINIDGTDAKRIFQFDGNIFFDFISSKNVMFRTSGELKHSLYELNLDTLNYEQLVNELYLEGVMTGIAKIEDEILYSTLESIFSLDGEKLANGNLSLYYNNKLIINKSSLDKSEGSRYSLMNIDGSGKIDITDDEFRIYYDDFNTELYNIGIINEYNSKLMNSDK